MRRRASPTSPAPSRKLRKPGPATSTRSTPSSVPSRSANSSAICRGGRRSLEASANATFDAQSPWVGSLGRSMRNAASSAPIVSAAVRIAWAIRSSIGRLNRSPNPSRRRPPRSPSSPCRSPCRRLARIPRALARAVLAWPVLSASVLVRAAPRVLLLLVPAVLLGLLLVGVGPIVRDVEAFPLEEKAAPCGDQSLGGLAAVGARRTGWIAHPLEQLEIPVARGTWYS